MHVDEQPPLLREALGGIVRRPWLLLRSWNWKTALFSVLIRGTMFLLTNLRAGHGKAVKAMLVEMVYAAATAGVLGGFTQRLRNAVPRRLTGLVLWVGVPLTMLALEALWHALNGTPRLFVSMVASFVLAALGTGFNWFAMQRGAFVTGSDRPFLNDLASIPMLLAAFVTAPFRALFHRTR